MTNVPMTDGLLREGRSRVGGWGKPRSPSSTNRAGVWLVVATVRV